MNWMVLGSAVLLVAAISTAETEVAGNSLESKYCIIGCDHSTGYLQPDGSTVFGSDDCCTISYESTVDDLPDITIGIEVRFHERTEHTLRMELGSETVTKTFTGNRCEVTFEDIDLAESKELRLNITGGLEEDPLRMSIKISAIADGCASIFR